MSYLCCWLFTKKLLFKWFDDLIVNTPFLKFDLSVSKSVRTFVFYRCLASLRCMLTYGARFMAVIFSQASISHSFQGGGWEGVCIPAWTGQTPPWTDTPWADTPWADTPWADHPAGRHTQQADPPDRHPLGQTPPGRHPPAQCMQGYTNPFPAHAVMHPMPSAC